MSLRRIALLAVLGLASGAQAADPAPAQPAARAAAPRPAAAPARGAAPAAAPAAGEDFGTTIFGDQETPIGLFITPWKESYAERGLDRPPRLFDEAIAPIDHETFHRQLSYWRELTRYRDTHPGPDAPAGSAKP